MATVFPLNIKDNLVFRALYFLQFMLGLAYKISYFYYFLVQFNYHRFRYRYVWPSLIDIRRTSKPNMQLVDFGSAQQYLANETLCARLVEITKAATVQLVQVYIYTKMICNLTTSMFLRVYGWITVYDFFLCITYSHDSYYERDSYMNSFE